MTPSDPVKVSPLSFTIGLAQDLPDEKAQEEITSWSLFDRDTTTTHLPWPSGTSWIDVDLGREVDLLFLKLYGSASYWLTVSENSSGSWRIIPSLNNVNLEALSSSWNRLPTNAAVRTRHLRLEFRPRPGQGTSTGIRELEIWGTGELVTVADGHHLRSLLARGVNPTHLLDLSATPTEETAQGGTAARFTVTLSSDPRLLKRAYLTYEAFPLSHWVSAIRRINGFSPTGGFPTLTNGHWAEQVERINPLTLRRGDNQIEFSVGNGDGGYRIRNLRLLAELDNGGNFLELTSTQTSTGTWVVSDPLFDGDLSTGVSPSGKTIELRFDEATEPDSLLLHVQGSLKGEATLHSLQGGNWTPLPTGSTLNLNTLTQGWNSVSLPAGLGAQSGLRLTFSEAPPGQADSSGQITEIKIAGSVVGGRTERKSIRVSAPEAGEFFGRSAYLVGWVDPASLTSGSPTLYLDGKKVEGFPVTSDGAFSLAVSKDAGSFASLPDDAPWSATLKAVFPDGAELFTTVNLLVNLASPTLSANGGNTNGALATTSSSTFTPSPRRERERRSETVYPDEGKTIRFKRVFLEIPAGAVTQPVEITIEALTEEDLARLNPGMINVTADDAGYRFLPSGLTFKKPVRVGIPYEKNLLPTGIPEETTLTHFHQENAERWQKLSRLNLDTLQGIVVSETDHFTDMINATLVLPEHPQPLSYNPNSIKDIKAADPGAGITLIEAPQGNAFGTAQASYPLKLPPGRGAFQPDLRIVYNGNTQNGWLGIGWDLPTPNIQVDTRFGVPRYTGEERYLLDGAQLKAVGGGRFQTRVEGQFRRIIRHGDNPTTFSWEVTDKDGTRFLYGTTAQARLASYATGHIFQWNLETVIDPNGNTTEFVYQKDQQPESSGGEPWTQIYVKEITYTGHSSGLSGRYHVRFVLDDGSRPDKIITGRSGFKVLTRFRLNHVDVMFDATLIRRYQLTYTIGDFRKTLLTALAERGEGAQQEFYRHEFEYFAMPKSGNTVSGFSDVTTWPGASRIEPFLTRSDELSFSHSTFIGIGPPQFPPDPHVGFIRGYSHGDEDTKLQLVDLNGDGLPDLIGKGASVRLNQLSGDRITGSFDKQEFPGLRVLNETERNAFTAGGAFHTGVDSIQVSSTYTYSLTDSRSLLSDLNGDGFIDQIERGSVLFNTGSGFSPTSPLKGYVTTNLDFGLDGIRDQVKRDFHLTDPIRRWKAPFAGTVRLTGAITKILTGGDGLKARLFLNNTLLWERTIGTNDTTPCEPAPTNACAVPGQGGLVFTVSPGDDLYALVNALDDTDFDFVTWDPVVTYLEACRRDPLTGQSICGSLTTADLTEREPNGSPLYRFQASTDFSLAGAEADLRTRWKGTVRLTALLSKQVTSDDVRVRILHQGSPIFERLFAWDETATLSQEFTLNIQQSDALSFRIESDSQIDPNRVQWTPTMTYTRVCETDPQTQQETCQDLSPEEQQNRTPSGDLFYVFQAQLTSPVHVKLPSEPLTPWVAPKAGQIRIRGSVETLSAPSAIVSIKGVNRVVRKLVLSSGGEGPFLTEDIFLQVTPGEQFTFTVDAATELSPDQIRWTPTIVYPVDCRIDPFTQEEICDPTFTPPVHFTFNDPAAPTEPFAGGFHRWYYGEWNGSEPFNEAFIRKPSSATDEETLKRFRAMTPKREGETFAEGPLWRGTGHKSFINSERMNPSRLGTNVTGVFSASLQGIVQKALARNFTVGVSILGGSLSVNFGDAFSKLDLLDINGDRYPDQVSKGRVRFNNGEGSFGDPEAIEFGGDLREFTNANATLGFGLGIATNQTDAKAETKEVRASIDPTVIGVSVNFGATYGISQTTVELVDMNGDGLPDRVTREPGSSCFEVRLNLGYRFGSPECWPTTDWEDVNLSLLPLLVLDPGVLLDPLLQTLNLVDPNVLRHGDNLSRTGGVSVGAGTAGIGAGVSLGEARTTVDLVDINGDGLPDQIMKRPGEGFFRVKLNLGDRFSDEEQRWMTPKWSKPIGIPDILDIFGESDSISFTGSASVSSNAGLGLWIPILPPPLPWVFTIVLELSGGGAFGTSGLQLQFSDINGDGLPDHLLKVLGDNDVFAKINQTGKTNLLKTIRRPLGAVVSLDYTREGNTPAMPQSQWSLTQVTLDDGVPGDGVSQYVTAYRYTDGFFDRAEREFYGFATVTETRPDSSQLAQTFHNRDFFRKGLLAKAITRDRDGRLFLKTEHHYQLREIADSVQFPARVETANFFYEGQTADEAQFGKSTRQEFDYDSFGNVSLFIDRADAGADDDVFARIAYTQDVTTYIVGLPTHLRVTDTAGRLFRERRGTYDARGNLTRLESTLVGGTSPVHRLEYDSFGNLTTLIDPKGYTLRYEYDPDVKTHIARIQDSFGYVSQATYNLKYGLIANSTDLNRNLTTYSYDAFGRLVTVVGPYDIGSPIPTLRFFYDHQLVPARAITQNKEHHTTATTLDTILFVDGLKRVIQTKKEADVEQGSSPVYGVTVTGKVLFDAMGRLAQQGQPVFQQGFQTGFFTDIPLRHPTAFFYDILGRTTQTVAPDGATTTVRYDFAESLFHTTVTDAEGKVRHTHRAIPDRIVAVDEVLSGQRFRTRYAYSILGELTTVVDVQGNTTHVTYDTLGRRTGIDNPDTGQVTYTYDASGNVTAKADAKLRAASQQISYLYDFNRLREIRYPTSVPVTYTYGSPGAPFNRAGRIVTVSDESGSEERFYGKLGETVKSIKTVASETGRKPEAYTTQMEFDSFARMRTLVYPDSEVLTYTYDNGGLLQSAIGEKRGNRYIYVKHLGYDEFGQRVRVLYGNQVETRYQYDARTRRLAHLRTTSATGTVLQDLTYRYDLVGNILGTTNATPVQRDGNVPLGPVEQSYVYDDLYRLTQATGQFSFSPGKVNRYTSVFAYDPIHNLTQKVQLHKIIEPPGSERDLRETTYTLNFQYGGLRPHAVTEDEERTYQYDPSGNLVRWEEKNKGTHRAIRWNEENRISEVEDGGRTTAFRYNADGERVLKRGQFGETAFVGQFYTVRNGEIATKHVFAGNTRVASQLVRLKPREERPVARGSSRERSTTTVGASGGTVQLAAGPGAVSGPAAVVPAQASVVPSTSVAHGPSHPTGLERAAEVGQGKKLGVMKQLEGRQLDQSTAPPASAGSPTAGPTPQGSPAEGRGTPPPGQAKPEKGDSAAQGQGNRPEWAGPHETRGLDRALEVGQGKKLGILKQLDGDGPPPVPPGPPPVTPPPDRGHTSPAIEGPPPHEFQLFFYHGDHLGSSNVITDAFAGVFEHVEYFPFGEPWVDEGGTATLLPYKFTGKELDPETGLYYYGARYYEPRLQRWLSPDALESVLRVGVPPAHNPYQYTLWNPLRFVDPTGLEEEQSWSQRVWAALTSPFRKLEEGKEREAERAGEASGELQKKAHLAFHRRNIEAWEQIFGEPSPERALAEEKGEVTRESATKHAQFGLDVAETLAPLPPVGKVGKVGRVGKGAARLERHHQLPRQFKKEFERAGLKIEEFVVDLPRDVHRLKPGGLHTGPENWNRQWAEFFKENPNYSRQDILNQLNKMQKQFGL